MSDFRMVQGFEDVWRPPLRPRRRTPETILRGVDSGAGARDRLTRLVDRAPEVMVKVSGRTRDRSGLSSYLKYISRNSRLALEDRDGAILDRGADLKTLTEDWTAIAQVDRRRRANSPLSLSLMLSMPAGTDPVKMWDAARAFAEQLFASEHDYVFALHTDTPSPHVHMAISARGDMGQRLNPRKVDLEHWRQVFAQALRDRGVEAEATPRRARGVTRKPEGASLRKIRERYEAGGGEMGTALRSAYRKAARAAFGGEVGRTPWEERLLWRQARIRGLYLAQAGLLKQSADLADQALGARLEAFVSSMPQPDSQRLALARDLRAASLAAERDAEGKGERVR